MDLEWVERYPWLIPVAYLELVEGARLSDYRDVARALHIPMRLAKSILFYYNKIKIKNMKEKKIKCWFNINKKLFIIISKTTLFYAIPRKRSIRAGKIPLKQVIREVDSIPFPLKKHINEIKIFINECTETIYK